MTKPNEKKPERAAAPQQGQPPAKAQVFVGGPATLPPDQAVRLECLKAAVECRTPGTQDSEIVAKAGLFERFVLDGQAAGEPA